MIKPKMRVTTVNLQKEHMKILNGLQLKTGRSQATFLRQAWAEFVVKYSLETEESEKERKTGVYWMAYSKNNND